MGIIWGLSQTETFRRYLLHFMARFCFITYIYIHTHTPVLSLVLAFVSTRACFWKKKNNLQHRGGSLWSRACCRKKLWIYSVYHRCRRSGTPASSTVSTASWLTAEDIKIDAKLNLVPTTAEQHLPDGVSTFPPVHFLRRVATFTSPSFKSLLSLWLQLRLKRS